MPWPGIFLLGVREKIELGRIRLRSKNDRYFDLNMTGFSLENRAFDIPQISTFAPNSIKLSKICHIYGILPAESLT